MGARPQWNKKLHQERECILINVYRPTGEVPVLSFTGATLPEDEPGRACELCSVMNYKSSNQHPSRKQS